MKVLHIAKYDLKGGAAIAAHNSVLAQREIGIDARMAVGRKLGNDPFVSGPKGWRDKLALVNFAAEQVVSRLICADPRDSRSLGFFGQRGSTMWSEFAPDVVVLHNIDGVLGLRDIRRIPAPVVWRMHDMWAVSGHRHYAGDYYTAPRLSRVGASLDRYLRKSKTRLVEGRQLLFCPPSQWLAGEVRDRFGPAADVAVVPNSVDTAVFRSLSQKLAREKLGISHSGPLLLFGAASGTSDPRKGVDLLAEAMATYREVLSKQNVELLVFGGEWPSAYSDILPVRSLGKITSRANLSMVYSAADLTVVPSREENLSMTVLESLACGTPVAAFNIGGMPDMIEHGINGFLIEPFDVSVLGRALIDIECATSMRTAARHSILGRFDRPSEAHQMQSIFQELIERDGTPAL